MNTHTTPFGQRSRGSRIRRLSTAALVAGTAFVLAAPTVSAGGDEPIDEIALPEPTCPNGGKVDVAGNHQNLVVNAPAGKLIAGYCVKAGSAQQGDGPEHYVVDPPQAQVVISHSSGKDISHYTLVLVDIPEDEPEIPEDEPEIPEDEPEIPGDEPEIPGDEPEIPGDEPETPADEPTVPTGGDEPEVESLTPTPTVPTASTVPAVSADSLAPAAVVDVLPSTGSETTVIAILATMLVALGGLVTRFVRPTA